MDQSSAIAAQAAEIVRLREVLSCLVESVSVKVEQVSDGYAIGFVGHSADIQAGKFLRIESVARMIRPDDDCRGVGEHHDRIRPATDAEFDRLAAECGIYGETAEPTDDQWQGVLLFLHDLIAMGSKRREIFFSRLTGIEWRDIGRDILNGASPQAAQKEWAETLKVFPHLERALKPKEMSREN